MEERTNEGKAKIYFLMASFYCLKAYKEEGQHFLQFNVYGLVKRPFRMLRHARGKIVLRKKVLSFLGLLC